jgi:aminoglycoside phosphotransferase (APT) family kinase protein
VDFYSYTSGRFIYNEQARLKERYVGFDVNELYGATHRAIGQQHGFVKQMIKLVEGGFNRVFLLRMKDGFKLIAKVPYYIAAPTFYATASEAATLTYLKSKGIPVPEVYAYCAQKDNIVGNEYILLEEASGVSAFTRWTEMPVLEIRRPSHSIVELEKKLYDLPFGASGSLYFQHDIPPSSTSSALCGWHRC